jgi:hypothetical protein
LELSEGIGALLFWNYSSQAHHTHTYFFFTNMVYAWLITKKVSCFFESFFAGAISSVKFTSSSSSKGSTEHYAIHHH